jgi:hypothetical protein
MCGSYFFHGKKFSLVQIIGCFLILVGAIISSSVYLNGSSMEQNIAGFYVLLYIISLIPSSISNIYKEQKMKRENLNEIHTSTIVTFWQMIIGFLYLPLTSIIYFHKISYTEMYQQISEGYSCFQGEKNIYTDFENCENAGNILIAYTVVNFCYNVLLLSITKRGSAVLLVVSQVIHIVS